MKKTFDFIKTYFALIVVGVAFLWAAISVATYQTNHLDSDKTTIRMAHWQLETGVREGLEALIKDYEAIHPNVHIILDNIPENAYGQWVTSQLTGNTAPDLMEFGLGLPPSVWLAFQSRYFLPLTSVAYQPNPYNKGTELEGLPLRQTCQNGMLEGYVEQLQEFMTVQLSQLNARVLYNKDLLKKLTGLSEPPKDFRSFLAVCETIKKQKDPKGRFYIPIAASKPHFTMWDNMLCLPITFGAVKKCDFNRDGFADVDEVLIAFQKGILNFHYPPFQARLKMVEELNDQFQVGYTGLGRDEAVFLFAQNRAVFISAGTFDAQSLVNQANGSFELGMCKFPVPSKDDPEFGKYIEGPFFETQSGGFKFGLTRASKHPEVAIDFLLFLTAQKQNQKLNEIMGWLPITIGAKPKPWLAQFAPQTEGMYEASEFTKNSGGEIVVMWEQIYSLFKVGQISIENLTDQFEKFYLEKGLPNYKERTRDWRRAMVRNEQMLASIRYKARHSKDEASTINWIKYRIITWTRQWAYELNNMRVAKWVEQGKKAQVRPPYEFSEKALENIQRKLNIKPDQIKEAAYQS